MLGKAAEYKEAQQHGPLGYRGERSAALHNMAARNYGSDLQARLVSFQVPISHVLALWGRASSRITFLFSGPAPVRLAIGLSAWRWR
jgi:hypothetical protein